MTSVCAHLMQRDRVLDSRGWRGSYTHTLMVFSYFIFLLDPTDFPQILLWLMAMCDKPINIKDSSHFFVSSKFREMGRYSDENLKHYILKIMFAEPCVKID